MVKQFTLSRSKRTVAKKKREGYYSERREEQNPRTKRKGFYFRALARKQSSRAKRRGFYFVCPKHGRIPRDEVIFLCNTCDPKEVLREMLIERGMYVCPQCLQPGENFQCFLCGSTKVEMRKYKKIVNS